MKLGYETDSAAKDIIACKRCPRLLKHCQMVAEKKKQRLTRFANDNYWGKPVPNFGKLPAKLLIVGLAPGAHGANRTSRMFTGDDSGKWLYRALHRAGFAETAGFEQAGDNSLIDCAITSAGHCAPPDNKPTTKELEKCAPFLLATLQAAKPKAILCLGSIAWNSAIKGLRELGYEIKAKPAFGHGVSYQVKGGPLLMASYHPSRQNTNTKRLTEPMFDAVFTQARKALS